jgi:hypothetical protein
MLTLNSYSSILTPEQKNATDAYNGYLLELAVKDYYHKTLAISKPGKLDLQIMVDGHKRNCEVKQNGGDFRFECKGNSYIAYCVYIEPGKDLRHQLGYVMPMTVFKTAGYALNHIRKEKLDSKGNCKMALQTLYNYTKADFHGKKAFKLIDMWEENGAVPFKDFFTE